MFSLIHLIMEWKHIYVEAQKRECLLLPSAGYFHKSPTLKSNQKTGSKVTCKKEKCIIWAKKKIILIDYFYTDLYICQFLSLKMKKWGKKR